MRRKILLEVLEDRCVLNADLGSLEPELLGPPSNVDIVDAIVQIESEPNDTLEAANRVELTPEPIFWIMAADDGPLAELQTMLAPALESVNDIVADVFPLIYPGPLPDFVPPQTGNISGDLLGRDGTADTDFFVFNADAERLITITLTGAAVLDGAVVRLLDADGQTLAGASLETDADGNRLAGLTLDHYSFIGGTFFVQISSGSAGGADDAADYNLHMTVATDPYHEHEPNDTLAQANPIDMAPMPIMWMMGRSDMPIASVPAGPNSAIAGFAPWFPPYDAIHTGYITGSLDPTDANNDVDHFSFAADAERLISLSIDGDAVIAGASFELLDADGNVLAVAQQLNDPNIDALNRWTSLSHYTRPGGSFFVRVSTPANSFAPTAGAYSIHVNVAPDPYSEHEPNNSFETANAIELTPSFSRFPPTWPIELAAPATFAAPVNRLWAPWWGWDWERQSGSISGDLSGGATAGPLADQDFFTLKVEGQRWLRLELSGGLADNGGRITLFDANQQELASADGSNPSLDWLVADASAFYVRITQSTSNPDAGDNDTTYTLSAAIEPLPNPAQGPDEREPNNNFEQANPLWLTELDVGPLGTHAFRSASALGIAGGPQADRDVFQFDVRAGEQVRVSLDGLLRADDGGLFATLTDWAKANQLKLKAKDTLATLLERFPDLQGGAIQVAVFDAAGNQIGSSSDQGADPCGVSFHAAEDGTYFAVVSIKGQDSARFVHYRLGVLADGMNPLPLPEVAASGADLPPLVRTLKPGQTLKFLDASGDQVKISWRGGRGTATISFTGATADGSDIASIVLDNAKGGSLIVQAKGGAADVGSIVVHGLPIRKSIAALGQIKVDGDVGSIFSDTNVNSVIVAGDLGGLSAPGRRIAQLKATVFDTALLHVADVKRLQVQTDLAVAALAGFQTDNAALPVINGTPTTSVHALGGDSQAGPNGPTNPAASNGISWGAIVDAFLNAKKNGKFKA